MSLKDTGRSYGWASQLLHWGVALSMIGMFILGYWMRTLDYYSPYYQTAPHIHESIGMLLFIFVPLFLYWRYRNSNPSDDHLKPYERTMASIMKKTLYLIMFALLFTGYLLATLGNTAVEIFNWVSIPAVLDVDDEKLLVGNIHEYLSYLLMGLAVIHAGAALKHHILDKDDTLKRILPFYDNQETQEN